ncbi:hypothetical protein AUP74_02318 [Microbulbifer aggregans]|uniref:Uncharacterized protein n=1 Tax=Microbulbifer aggregans TaxID=1769779 RepID=A0A1C9W985_9GAMM|nr:hypothetical protein [Microbulbifer aggregans]AOS97726.1 hypothetical protein AUP74_02318 [Microbulbifer aggregans]
MKNENLRFYTVTRSDISNIYRQLENNGRNGSCAIFAFFPDIEDSKNHVELQYCIENDVVGLDWVLLGDIKTRDKEKFLSFSREKGFSVKAQEMNNIKYFRVSSGDLVGLMNGIISNMYGVSKDRKMELIAGRFEVVDLNYSAHELYSPYYMAQ